MKAYALKRMLVLVPVVLGVATLVFCFLRMVPGDPVTIMLGEQASVSDVEAMRVDLGLDKPALVQYLVFLKGLAKGDLGRSFRSGKPVREVVFERYPKTIVLALTAMCIALLIAFPMGIVSALKRDTAVDVAAGGFALLGVSMPVFWLGPLLILLFSIHLRLLPVSGGDGPAYLILPAVTLGFAMAGIVSRLVRSGLIEVQGAPYIRAAKAKGVSPAKLLMKHSLRNALLPVITVVGLQMGALLGGAVITETIFSWPGVGSLLIEAIRARDYPLVQGCVLVISVTYILINLLTDFAYAVVDPRIRLGGDK